MKLSKKILLPISAVLLFLFFYTASFSQLTKRANTPIPGANSNGFLEWLPNGYNTGTQRYPLMIYINGIGSTGDGSPGVQGIGGGLENHFTGGGYPHEQQRQGSWVDEYTVGGQSFRFVIITPQFLTPMHIKFPTPEEINAVINYAIAKYRVDESRIYLVGQSQGAGSVWNYPGASSAYARRIAAIVPFAGVSYPIEAKANIIKYNSVAVWALHNQFDAQVPSYFTNDYVDFINAPPPPPIPARKTIIVPFNPNGTPNTEHNIWFPYLTRQLPETGLNIYQWMLQYQRSVSRANAGDFQTIRFPANTVTLTGSGTGPNGSATGFNWQKLSGPGGANFSNASAATTTVSGLEPGVHTFRLTVTDNGGGTATSDVRVLVQPATTRIQAENHTAMLGVQNEATEDEGGGVHVGFIHRGDWMEYSVTVPTAGNYKFRFRLASFVSGAMFDVRTTSGSILDTIEVFDTGAWQNFLTKTVTLPLVSGTQTLRFQSIAEGGYNFNWFEFESSIANAVLPVNFTLFNANCVNGAVNLLWKTTGSVNSQNFAIEKSRDGTTWTALASVPFDNQNATEQTFRYKDGTAGENAFYRVVEIARDGRRSLSTIIKSNCNTKQNFSVYPNPVADNAYVNITLTSGSRVQVAIIDNKGAVVHQQNSVLPSGSNQLTINVNRLPKGVYTLRATWDNEKRNIQLIKK